MRVQPACFPVAGPTCYCRCQTFGLHMTPTTRQQEQLPGWNASVRDRTRCPKGMAVVFCQLPLQEGGVQPRRRLSRAAWLQALEPALSVGRARRLSQVGVSPALLAPLEAWAPVRTHPPALVAPQPQGARDLLPARGASPSPHRRWVACHCSVTCGWALGLFPV